MNRHNIFAPKNTRNSIRSHFKFDLTIKPLYIIIPIAIILLGIGAFALIKGGKSVIVVNGKNVVCVSSAGEANNVIETIKSKSASDITEVNFKQSIRVDVAPRGAHVVSRHMALRRLEKYVSPVISRLAIIADGKAVVAVSDKKTAGKVLELAKLKFGSQAKNLMEEPQIKESISIETAAVNPKMFKRTPQEALDYLFAASNSKRTEGLYSVKKGDIAVSIAKKFHIKRKELWNLNPHINLNHLSIGDKIKINKLQKTNNPKLTVLVRDLIDRTEHFKAPTQKVSSASLYVGKSVLLDAGSAGLREVKIAVIYENGSKVGTELVEENIIKEPIPRQIAVGIKPLPTW